MRHTQVDINESDNDNGTREGNKTTLFVANFYEEEKLFFF